MPDAAPAPPPVSARRSAEPLPGASGPGGQASNLLQDLLGAARPPAKVRVRHSMTSPGVPAGVGPAPHSPPAPALFPPRPGPSTGSSLLDTLVGLGAENQGDRDVAHYPLLDALGDAMQGMSAGNSPRHWPAARVEVALPELLRRVAAGLRAAQSAA